MSGWERSRPHSLSRRFFDLAETASFRHTGIMPAITKHYLNVRTLKLADEPGRAAEFQLRARASIQPNDQPP